MEERKEVVRLFVSKGMRVQKAVSIANLCKSTYYYKSSGLRKGKLPSSFTFKGLDPVANSKVVSDIEEIISEEFNDYGYHRVTQELKNRGYLINHKKVYRLMKENHLLFSQKITNRSIQKQYVRYASPLPKGPFEVIEADFKYVYIEGEQKNAYLITLLDTFSRFAFEWALEYNMKTDRVVERLSSLDQNWIAKRGLNERRVKIGLRTDNGAQFIASKLAEKLSSLKIDHEFIHPGTPQENGHIEAFHSTVQKLVCDKYSFENLKDAQEVFKRFYSYYNHKRIMKSILNKSPETFLELWDQGKIGIRRARKKQTYFFREKPCQWTETSPSEAFISPYIESNNNLTIFNSHQKNSPVL